jgi:type I restriction enzyme, S subunit
MNPLQQFIAERTPDGWQTLPFWSLFQRVKKTGYADEELLSVYRDYGVIPKSSRDDNHNKESEDLSGYQLVDKGYLVTNKMKAWQGSIAISRYRGIVSPAYYVYKPLSTEHDDQFLHYLLRSGNYIALYGRISKGVRVNQWDLEHEALRNIPVLFPSREKQKEIADFLDREIARIDQLIEKKKWLIIRLKEKSASLVTECILQGYKDFPARSSAEKDTHPDKFWPQGVTSLLKPLKLFCQETSSLSDKTDPDFEIQYIDIGNVSFADGLKGTAEYSFKDAPSRARQILKKHDVIISTVRTYLKACAYIDRNDPNLIGSTGFCVLRANDKIYPKYLYRAVQSEPFISGVVVRSEGVSYPAVNDKLLKALKIPVPDLDTQRKISNEIEQGIHPIIKTVELMEKSIETLENYKVALITQTVTGQLDIHAWQKRGAGDRQLDKIEQDTEQEHKSKKARA